MGIARIHHLGLTVTDADASADWYAQVLGFRRTGEYARPDGKYRKVFLSHELLGIRLGLCQYADAKPDEFDEGRVGLDHISFAVDSATEILEWEQRLRSLGVTHSPSAPANTISGARVLVFRDPDNIQLELIADP